MGEEVGFTERVGRDLSIFIPKKRRIIPPAKERVLKERGLLKSFCPPVRRINNIIISAIPCPKVINGPVLNPFLGVSEITEASKGPGITAPEKVMIKEIKNIER